MIRRLRIGMVAGESSGDMLGASLIRSLKKQTPDIIVEGIGGPLMIAEGCQSFFPMDRLSVMGLVEPLKRLPELLNIRRSIKKYFLQNPPDVFIGIDSPDFNLHIEKFLKQHSIKTVHYVSPSVWAWRQGRIHNIKNSVTRMLTLLPFEQAIYQQHNIPVTFVGHPLADEFPLEPQNTQTCQRFLGLADDKTYIALLPGSRENEVKLLAPVFCAAARRCVDAGLPGKKLHFLIPAANPARQRQLQALLASVDIPYTLFAGQSHAVMAASELVVMASGTTTLEAMLLKKPMVVCYKMAPFSYAIISCLLKIPYVSLPNLLAQKMLVPELIQGDATAEQISRQILSLLGNKTRMETLKQEFTAIHQSLRCNAAQRAAQTVLEVIGEDLPDGQ
jgi:lipid-A-disaccharide synthase